MEDMRRPEKSGEMKAGTLTISVVRIAILKETTVTEASPRGPLVQAIAIRCRSACHE